MVGTRVAKDIMPCVQDSYSSNTKFFQKLEDVMTSS
jgi:hypothetical protein